MKQSTSIIYLGTPDFAVLPLLELVKQGYKIVGVFTQPDKPKGRGKELSKSPVKLAAENKDLPVYQPASKTELTTLVRELNPDVAIVAAYGMIIPKEALVVPKNGFINIHGSLLPKYRGASPVQEALLAGDEETGVTIMHMDAGMDTGDVISSRSLRISPEDTTDSLMDKLSLLGSQAVVETLPRWLKGTLPEIPQDDRYATYCTKITKEDGHIDWNLDAITIARQVRAYYPWPGSFSLAAGMRLKILKASIAPSGVALDNSTKGRLFFDHGHIYVATAKGAIELLEIQPEAKKKMLPHDYINGNKHLDGVILS